MYVLGKKGSKLVEKFIGPMEENGIAYELSSGANVSKKYSGQMNFPDDYKCVFEGDSGILKASKAMEVIQVSSEFVVLKCIALGQLLSNSSGFVRQTWWKTLGRAPSDWDSSRHHGYGEDEQGRFSSKEAGFDNRSLDQLTP